MCNVHARMHVQDAAMAYWIKAATLKKKKRFWPGTFLWYREHETFARVKEPVVFAFSCDHGMGAKYTEPFSQRKMEAWAERDRSHSQASR